AQKAFVNNQQTSLLTTLRSGDIVRIITSPQPVVRYSWLDAVKTSKAKHQIRTNTATKIKEVERQSAYNIMATIFGKTPDEIIAFVKDANIESSIHRVCTDETYLQELTNRIENAIRKEASFFTFLKIRVLKLKEYTFENLRILSNFNISEVLFDYCCHPKLGDEIIAFKSGSKAFVHHKLCERAYGEIHRGGKMLFVAWIANIMEKFVIIVAFEKPKTMLVEFLQFLVRYDINILSVDLGSSNPHCEIHIECYNYDIKSLRSLLERFRIIDIYNLKDAYSNN
ncbi:MAG: penta-phosphate guanosine-3'-pyrophosphohydrolase, partial [Helicobacter sp.]|nr:penta-phosphate guanosine-3'-pyrophosphohydrolase [Helicobacter sp.]